MWRACRNGTAADWSHQERNGRCKWNIKFRNFTLASTRLQRRSAKSLDIPQRHNDDNIYRQPSTALQLSNTIFSLEKCHRQNSTVFLLHRVAHAAYATAAQSTKLGCITKRLNDLYLWIQVIQLSLFFMFALKLLIGIEDVNKNNNYLCVVCAGRWYDWLATQLVIDSDRREAIWCAPQMSRGLCLWQSASGEKAAAATETGLWCMNSAHASRIVPRPIEWQSFWRTNWTRIAVRATSARWWSSLSGR